MVEVGATDCNEYVEFALEFSTRPKGTTILEQARLLGEVVRYDTFTQEFSVVSSDGFLKTYFKPDPARHGLPTNMDYYLQEIAKP
jgi:pyocin large subunit-like protein